MTDEQAETPEEVEIPIQWRVADNIASRYATNFIVQHGEYEFTIYFFEVKPPLFLGTPDSVQSQVNETTYVPADCIGKVIIAAARMPDFIDLMQRSHAKFVAAQEKEGAS